MVRINNVREQLMQRGRVTAAMWTKASGKSSPQSLKRSLRIGSSARQTLGERTFRCRLAALHAPEEAAFLSRGAAESRASSALYATVHQTPGGGGVQHEMHGLVFNVCHPPSPWALVSRFFRLLMPRRCPLVPTPFGACLRRA